MAVASSPAGGSRRWAVAAAAYDSGVSSETFDHSISEARSRTAALSSRSRSRPPASATALALCGITSGDAPPMACGQK